MQLCKLTIFGCYPSLLALDGHVVLAKPDTIPFLYSIAASRSSVSRPFEHPVIKLLDTISLHRKYSIEFDIGMLSQETRSDNSLAVMIWGLNNMSLEEQFDRFAVARNEVAEEKPFRTEQV